MFIKGKREQKNSQFSSSLFLFAASLCNQLSGKIYENIAAALAIASYSASAAKLIQ